MEAHRGDLARDDRGRRRLRHRPARHAQGVVPPRQRVPRLRRRPRPTAEVIGILEQDRLADSAVGRRRRARRSSWSSTARPFYGESGGQVGDIGDDPGRAVPLPGRPTRRRTTTSPSTSARWSRGPSRSTTAVRAEVDADRREAIRRAHSATHVLHHALHLHLGKHAQQAGSKVEPDRLRFDFANPEAVGRERLRAIEETVNDRVLRAEPVSWTTMPIAEAKSLGAMALFGEKYPEVVRVVQMGDFSRELCGGTHLDNVGQVGLFKVVGEESVSAGHPADHRPDGQGRARATSARRRRRSPRSPRP